MGLSSLWASTLGQTLVSRALAQSAAPKRNVIFYLNVNGLVRDHAPSVTDGRFDWGAFDGLEPLRSRTTLVQYLNN
ncbi:MAG: hypothetical protein AAFQ82_16875, partial [Myxococcota bacterium]